MNDAVEYLLGPVTEAKKAQARVEELQECLKTLRTAVCGILHSDHIPLEEAEEWEAVNKAFEEANKLLGIKEDGSKLTIQRYLSEE